VNKQEIIFRPANENEVYLIHSFLQENFDARPIEKIKNFDLWIKEGKVKDVFVVNKQLSHILHNLPISANFAGTALGVIQKGVFILEIEGSFFLRSSITKCIHVKTDQFLYGKPIFASNISTMTSFEKGDWVIIMGANNLHYGIGDVFYEAPVKLGMEVKPFFDVFGRNGFEVRLPDFAFTVKYLF